MAKPIEKLSARELNTAYDKKLAALAKAGKAVVDAGRGSELVSETMVKTDPISLAYASARNAFQPLADELMARRRWHGSDMPIKRSA